MLSEEVSSGWSPAGKRRPKAQWGPHMSLICCLPFPFVLGQGECAIALWGRLSAFSTGCLCHRLWRDERQPRFLCLCGICGLSLSLCVPICPSSWPLPGQFSYPLSRPARPRFSGFHGLLAIACNKSSFCVTYSLVIWPWLIKNHTQVYLPVFACLREHNPPQSSFP